MSNDIPSQFKGRISCIVGGAGIGHALLIYPCWNMDGSQTGDGSHLAEEIGEQILPVAEHVDDDATPVLLAIVPRRTLCCLPIALKDPVAKLSAYRKNTSEEAAVDDPLQ